MALSDIATNVLLPVLERFFPSTAQRLKVNFSVGKERGRRPHPYSLWTSMHVGAPPAGDTAATAKVEPADVPAGYRPTRPQPTADFAMPRYVSWPGLADRRYTGRHLPPAAPGTMDNLPPVGQVVDTLFRRPEGQFTPCASTSALFCFFAQWFTDSFLRTDPVDRRRNTSNHEIDYCQIYGLDEGTTYALREKRGGLMRLENNLLPRLTDEKGAVRPEFYDLSYIRPGSGKSEAYRGDRLRNALGLSLTGHEQSLDIGRWTHLYASGLERGNSTIGYTALSTLAVREHNNVARALAAAHPGWDDDQLFETARNVMIRNVLQIVMEDYINHIVGGPVFRLDTSFAERETWYRTNRISIEFNLLYRWHSLVPDAFTVGDHKLSGAEYRHNNARLEQFGVEACVNAASTQKAGRIQLFNTPNFLLNAEKAGLDFSRTFELRPFVDYCDRFGERRPANINELVGGDAKAAAHLTALYGTVDRVELPVGLVAQARTPGNKEAVLPPLTRTMVAVDAFTHILTNPLLSEQVHNAAFADPAVQGLISKAGGIVGMAKRTQAPGATLKPSFKTRHPLPTD